MVMVVQYLLVAVAIAGAYVIGYLTADVNAKNQRIEELEAEKRAKTDGYGIMITPTSE